jgi:hypothetical protein
MTKAIRNLEFRADLRAYELTSLRAYELPGLRASGLRQLGLGIWAWPFEFP